MHFSGSSTDLTPSVIGYYDRLSTEISKSDQDSFGNTRNQQPVLANSKSSFNKLKSSFESSATKIDHKESFNNIRLTKISGLTGSSESSEPAEGLQPPPQTTTESNNKETRKPLQLLSPTVARLVAVHSNDNYPESSGADSGTVFAFVKPKQNGNSKRPLVKVTKAHTHIPLSKNTCKLSTQSGNDLIIDGIDEVVSRSEVNSHREVLKSTPPSHINTHRAERRSEERTPTNSNSDYESCAINPIDLRDQSTSGQDEGNLSEIGEVNLDDLKEALNRLSSGSDSTKMSCNSDIIGYEKSSSLVFKKPMLPQNGKTAVNSVNSIKQLKGSPKLSHRPLSVSSICSTSSSSSSGSDMAKQRTNYLASVESLADQSENDDSVGSSHNKNLTVLERAAMEIVDSERSYVEDLKQVIQGYLEDWRERACLRLDELNMLFSNIKEVCFVNLFVIVLSLLLLISHLRIFVKQTIF